MSSGLWPALVAAASSSWSRGHSPTGSSRPVRTGLNAATLMPFATAAAQIAAARTVLPTSVSVPVTKTPRIAAAGYSALGGFGQAVVDAAAHWLADRVERQRLGSIADDRPHRRREYACGFLKLGPSV